MKPKLLDLYCKAGGAGMGYSRAGFEVVGIDNELQKHYPFEFHQADAIEYLIRHWREFDAIHASPPCQDHIRSYTPYNHGTGYLLSDTRNELLKIARIWVIENVPGAPMLAHYRLCGCMFGLPKLRRERWFETSWNGFSLRAPCQHLEPIVTVVGHGIPSGSYYLNKIDGYEYSKLAKKAMGIDWMTRDELAQAIPPAYTEYIGQIMLDLINK